MRPTAIELVSMAQLVVSYFAETYLLMEIRWDGEEKNIPVLRNRPLPSVFIGVSLSDS